MQTTEPVQRRWRCRVLGCRWYFTAEGADLVWACPHCGNGGLRAYDDVQSARRMAAFLNRGAPRPPVGMLAALGGTVHRDRDRDRDRE